MAHHDVRKRRARKIERDARAGPLSGDFDAPLAVLDPDVVARADGAAVQMGASAEGRGAAEVAKTFSGRAQAAQPAIVNGAPGLVWASGGRPRVAFSFTIARGRIVAIDLVANQERLGGLTLVLLDA